MPGRYTQIAAHDDKGERHVVMVTRSPIPGSPHLRGMPRYTWHDRQTLGRGGQSIRIVPADDDAGIQVVRHGTDAEKIDLYVALGITRETKRPARVE
jgi:hypothetical protein